jgi:NAD(P)H-hydrate epimerase
MSIQFCNPPAGEMASDPEVLLTATEMTRADAAAVAGGVSSLTLMENAGRAVAEEIARRFSPRPTAVLTGPGKNGGDGFVVARHLKQSGWDVWVEFLVPPDKLKGDAAAMAKRFDGKALPISADNRMAELYVDALFGAGLDRPLEGEALRLAKAAPRFKERIIAIDVPSGVDGTTGETYGPAFAVALTVTFFHRKPGHLLMPGRALCGEVLVRDIGIPASVLEAIAPRTFANSPKLWSLPKPQLSAHKYARGHTLVVSGDQTHTGAARLAARGALRIGSGLVTVASPADALAVNAAHLTAIMLAKCDNAADLALLLEDERKNAVVLGPGNGVGEATRAKVEAALKSKAALVLDADALTSFEAAPHELFAMCREGTVLTPHAGEFARLFPGLLDGESLKILSPHAGRGKGEGAIGRLEAAREAARRSGAVIVLKGADTVIAATDGRAAINENAPPYLATAGSGDVLAGMIAGLLAQGMPTFEAACAAVWLHGAAATAFGPGLIAEDLPDALPGVLKQIRAAN